MKKVLIVLTNVAVYEETDKATGLWLGEATEFIEKLDLVNIRYDFVSPIGGFVPVDPYSLKFAEKATMSIYQQEDFQRRALSNSLAPSDIIVQEYFAIYYTGGHGVMWDFPNNEPLQKIAQKIYQQGGYILSVCHGIAGLLNLKDTNGAYLIAQKQVTGFTKVEERLALKKRYVPFFNEEEVKKRGAHFKKKRAYKSYAIKDQRIITGQNPFSVKLVANLLVEDIKRKEH